MELDDEVDAAYPSRWIGKVTVETHDGRTLSGRVDEPKGDPGNSLDRAEIEAKALRLAAFSGAATAEEMRESVRAGLDVVGGPRGRTVPGDRRDLIAPQHSWRGRTRTGSDARDDALRVRDDVNGSAACRRSHAASRGAKKYG